MLPGGTARGGHTLSALYAEATGGGGFDNAHDALADARALTTVWRWISSVEMGIAAPGAADEQARTRCFQAELQRLGYEAAAPSKPRAARGSAAAAAATPSKAKAVREKAKAAMEKAAEAPPLSGTAPLLDVPGVSDSPTLATRPYPAAAPRGPCHCYLICPSPCNLASPCYLASPCHRPSGGACHRQAARVARPGDSGRATARCHGGLPPERRQEGGTQYVVTSH